MLVRQHQAEHCGMMEPDLALLRAITLLKEQSA